MVPNSKFKELKATTTIDTSIEAVLAELLEAPAYYEGCEAGKSFYVKAIDDNQHVFYAYRDLPWPVKDRDIVTLLTVERTSDKKIKLHLKGLPTELPEKDKTIRVKDVTGFWLLEETNGQTQVTQQLYLDPEGSIPPLVTNSLLVKGPFKTFTELRASAAE